MRQSLVLCLVVLLVGVQCTSISDKYTALKSRRSLTTMMTQIEAKMATKAPLDAVLQQIDAFSDQVKEEQKSQSQLFENQSKECKDEFEFRTNEIAAANDAIQKSSTTLESCNAQKTRADSDHDNTVQHIQDTENYLYKLIKTRQEESDAFAEATVAYGKNSNAADEAVEILQQIWNGESSFVELAKHANTMLKQAISIKKVHKLTPVMAALAQLASKQLIADEGLLNQVLQLLREFRDSIETDYRGLEVAEQAAQELFNNNKSRTEEFLGALGQAKSDLEVEQSKLSQCINNQSAILSAASIKLQRNQDLLDSATKMCESFHNEFLAATEARNQELELISVIKQKVESRYSQISNLVRQRGSEDTFGAHVNENAYEHVRVNAGEQKAYSSSGAAAVNYERETSLESL